MRTPTASNVPAALLICLGIVSCFRGYDPSKIKCDDKSQCPSDYDCVRLPDQLHGTCARGTIDGSLADQSVLPGPDGPTSLDGIRPSDGRGDAPLDGLRDVSTGGTDLPADGRTDGSGGVAGSSGGNTGVADAAGTGGGTGGDLDAPLESDGSSSADAGLVQGSPCTGNEQCLSALCVDGVCCDKACTGCNACSASMTGGVDGTCAPVAAGADPHEACADETAATPANRCGSDGTCDGKGACRKVGAGQECGTASCSADGTAFEPAPTCDGNGNCQGGTPQVCTPYECATTGCKRTCSAQTQCEDGTYCDTAGGICVVKKTNGKTATQTFECLSGIIADGVCCDKACTDCNACTAALNGQPESMTGTCMPVTAAKAADPHGVCPAGTDPCGMDGTCNGAGACHYAAVGSDCGTPSCNASTSMLTKSTCNTGHTCAAGTASACPGLLACASTTACKTGACSTDGDCATGNFCASGTCTPKYDNGHSCTSGANNQCRSNNCVGTTCCATPCGECHTCANATGTCTRLDNGTPCGSGVCNNGTCSACTANLSCTVPTDECWNHATSCSTGVSECVRTTQLGNGTLCGSSASCNGNQSIGHWTCQGGNCTKPAATPCEYTCNTSTGLCAGECAPGTRECYSGSQYRICGSNYLWGSAQSCGSGLECTGAGTCACTTSSCSGCCSGNVCQPTKPTWYRDTDGDNYGVSSSTTQACTKPAGYAASAGDCCDSDVRAFPGSNYCLTTPRSGCGGYDYDCNGQQTECNAPTSDCPYDGLCSPITGVCTASVCHNYSYGFFDFACGTGFTYLVSENTCVNDGGCSMGGSQYAGPNGACR